MCDMIYVIKYVICRVTGFSGGISTISSICGWTLNRQVNCFVQFAQPVFRLLRFAVLVQFVLSKDRWCLFCLKKEDRKGRSLRL